MTTVHQFLPSKNVIELEEIPLEKTIKLFRRTLMIVLRDGHLLLRCCFSETCLYTSCIRKIEKPIRQEK